MKIRKASKADAHPIAEVHVLSWQHTYRGLVPDVYLDSMTVATRAAVWEENLSQGNPKVMVAEMDRRVVGFCSYGSSRDEDAKMDDGEIWAIYLLPAYCQKGIGRALLTDACGQLQAQGKKRISLWVITGNQPAANFYRSAGFLPDMPSLKTFDLAGKAIEEIRYVHYLGG